MKTYLVTEITHRVDGTSVVHCVVPENQRSLTLRLAGRPYLPPVITGAAYIFTWKYHLGRKEIVTAAPAAIPNKLWPHIVSKNFYAKGLRLPNKIKLFLLSIDENSSKKLTEDLSKQSFGLFEQYLQEPYISELKLHCRRSKLLQDAMTSMMQSGISQQVSEAIYDLYGVAYSEVMQDPIKLMEFQFSNSTTMSKECRFLKWLEHKSSCGSTVINTSDIPFELSGAAEWCEQNKLVIGGSEKIQLTTHAIQQRLLRLEIQRVCHGFFPKYVHSEIDYAYSRYSGLMGFLYEQNFLEAVSTSINSRFSYILSDSATVTNQYITEASAIIQLLGNSPPHLVARDQNSAKYYSSADADITYINDLPDPDSSYRTVIIPDLHHYTTGEYYQLFKKLTDRDRIIAISNLAAATESHIGTQIARQLATYFPSVNITPVKSTVKLPYLETSELNILALISELSSDSKLVAICDHPTFITKINSMSLQRSKGVVLIAAGSAFKRNDKVTIHPPMAWPEPSFFCRLISTNDNGLYAEAPKGHIRISSTLLNNSFVSPGFAMTPELACSIGIMDAVLVCRDTSKDKLINMLLDFKITIKKCLTYRTIDFTGQLPYSIQRITPIVE
jgi:hypothetical protein